MKYLCKVCKTDISNMARQARYCVACRKERDHNYHVAYNKDYNKRPENLHYGRKVSANFRKNHPERIKKWQKENGYTYSVSYRLENKIKVLKAYSKDPTRPGCVICGFDDFRALQIDHIDGGGSKHYKELGGKDLYVWLRQQEYPHGFQVLCANCNWIKRFTNNEMSRDGKVNTRGI